MQLFLISKSKKKSLSITLGPLTPYIFIITGMVVGLLAFYAGSLYRLNLTKDDLKSVHTEIASYRQHEIGLQQQMLEQAKANSEKNLDALATRLSKLQAYVMRLDALGSRLADMADLHEIDFGITNTPGLGGPKPVKTHGTMNISDFLVALEQLGLKLQDRSEKLAAMESMLIDRTLQNQTLPTGNPTADGWISSLFGMRTDPINGQMEFHGGVDYAGKSGSAILAVASGIVTWSGVRHGYGNIVEINHGSGYQTKYAHNKKNLVVVGQKVDKGQIIALMGTSGRSTGSHMHFEVVKNGKTINPAKHISLK